MARKNNSIAKGRVFFSFFFANFAVKEKVLKRIVHRFDRVYAWIISFFFFHYHSPLRLNVARGKNIEQIEREKSSGRAKSLESRGALNSILPIVYHKLSDN